MMLNGFSLNDALTHFTSLASQKSNTAHCAKNLHSKKHIAWNRNKNAILNPKNRNTEQNKVSDSVTAQDESNLLDTSKEPNVPNSEIRDLDANITYLINQISTLSSIAPPSQRKHSKQQRPTTVTKPPHCKKCGHPVKGHKRPKGNQFKLSSVLRVYVHLLMLIDTIVTVSGTLQTHRNNFTQSLTSKCYKVVITSSNLSVYDF